MIDSVLSFLKSLFAWVVDSIEWVLITVFNAVISALAAAAAAFVDLLPSATPSGADLPALAVPDASGNAFLSVLAWFLPVGHIVQSLLFYLSAALLYFSIAPLLRWVKILK